MRHPKGDSDPLPLGSATELSSTVRVIADFALQSLICAIHGDPTMPPMLILWSPMPTPTRTHNQRPTKVVGPTPTWIYLPHPASQSLPFHPSSLFIFLRIPTPAATGTSPSALASDGGVELLCVFFIFACKSFLQNFFSKFCSLDLDAKVFL